MKGMCLSLALFFIATITFAQWPNQDSHRGHPTAPRGWHSSTRNPMPFSHLKFPLHGDLLRSTPQSDSHVRFCELCRASMIDLFGNAAPTSSASGAPLRPFVAKRSVYMKEEWVRHFRSGRAPGNDGLADMAIDPSGNIYVTGSSLKTPNGFDFLTAKYDPKGTLLWQARHNGPGNDADHGNSLALDSDGNLYVTGTSSHDIATLKYSPDGHQEWASVYNNPQNTYDYGWRVWTDNSGSVYTLSSACRLTKYRSNGELEWRTALYMIRWPGAVANDEEGDIILTGHGFSDGGGYDYLATAKYDANGVEQWVVRYQDDSRDGPYPSQIAIDAAGNVLVAAVASGEPGYYLLLKYDSTGKEQWAAKIDTDGPIHDFNTGLVLSPAGEAFLAVTAIDGCDYTIIKFDPDGQRVWEAQYPGSRYDGRPLDAVFSPSGQVIVAGSTSEPEGLGMDFTLVSFDARGALQWANQYGGATNSYDYLTHVGCDFQGDIIAAGTSDESSTGRDYAVLKYAANGDRQWLSHLDEPGNSNEYPIAVGRDDAGNVYVAANSQVAGQGFNSIVIQYDSQGEQKWIAEYDDRSHGDDWVVDMIVTPEGVVYVTGNSQGSATEANGHFTLAYDSQGGLIWSEEFNSPTCSEIGRAIAVDHKGNICLTGEARFPSGDVSYLTISYDSNGERRWARTYPTAQHYNYANAIAVDGNGNINVTGTSYPSGFVTIQYAPNGAERWVAKHIAGSGDAEAVALALDKLNNVYVAGSEGRSTTTSRDFVVMKYDSRGVLQWTSYHDAYQSVDRASDLAVDLSGNVFVTGVCHSYDEGSTARIVKFDKLGVEQWSAQAPGGTDRPRLAVDGLGNAYAAGSIMGTEGAGDFATIKYNSEGEEQWLAKYEEPEGAHGVATHVAVDGWGAVYVTGVVGRSPGTYISTAKYVDDEQAGRPRDYHLSQSFPNPFNASSRIQYRNQSTGRVRLAVFNLMGQQVETLVDGIQTDGEYEVSWRPNDLPSGVYVYRLQAGGFVQTKKAVFVR